MIQEYLAKRNQVAHWLQCLDIKTEAQAEVVLMLQQLIEKSDTTIEHFAMLYKIETQKKTNDYLQAAKEEVRDMRNVLRAVGLNPDYSLQQYRLWNNGY